MYSNMDFSVINDMKDKMVRENPGCFNDDIEVYAFPQVWSSTALGFGGIGGQAISSANTVVLVADHLDLAYVFFNSGFAYKVKSITREFMEDVYGHRMKSVREVGYYRRP